MQKPQTCILNRKAGVLWEMPLTDEQLRFYRSIMLLFLWEQLTQGLLI